MIRHLRMSASLSIRKCIFEKPFISCLRIVYIRWFKNPAQKTAIIYLIFKIVYIRTSNILASQLLYVLDCLVVFFLVLGIHIRRPRTQLVQDKTHFVKNILFYAKRDVEEVVYWTSLSTFQYFQYSFVKLILISILISRADIRHKQIRKLPPKTVVMK